MYYSRNKNENKCGYADTEQVAKTLTTRVIYRIYTRYLYCCNCIITIAGNSPVYYL